MSEDDEDAIASIAEVIRRYFATRPAAADSVAGIQRWWLPTALHEEPLPLVELALDRLIEEGIVRRVTMEDGSVIYSSRRRRGDEDSLKDTR